MQKRINVVKFKRLLAVVAVSLISAATYTQAQEPALRQVTGIVRDAQDSPVAGASVVATGTTTGTMTDANGRYSINVPAGINALTFSLLGMKTLTLPIVGNVLDAVLEEDIQQLDDIVMIGYGTVKKSDLTGAVGSVSSDQITAIGSTSVLSALQGAAPGVDILTSSARPGGGFSIQIRGQNSLNAGEPLYVVNGIVVSDIDFLAPEDIERIDVLKDASSTAIYGSRGSNGVVVIQTKGAQDAKSRLSVSYDGYYGVRAITRIPDFMDGREVTDFRSSRYYAWSNNEGKYTMSAADQNAITQRSTLINTNLYNEQYTDWIDLGTDNGYQQSHTVNILGNSRDISYNIGAGVQKEKGNFMNEEMSRYNLRGSFTHKAGKYFTSGANFNLSHRIVNSGSQYGYRDLFRMMPFFNAFDENGEYVKQPGVAAAIGGSGNFTSSANPLIEIENGSSETKTYNVIGSAFAELSPVEGLSLKTTFSPHLNQRRAGRYFGRTPDRTNDEARTEHRTRFSYTWDNVISYNHTFAEKHALNLTLINSVYKTTEELLAVGAQNFSYNSEWYNIFNGTLVPSNNSATYSQVTLLSWAARANYDFANKYLLTGTVRYDGSSKLANKWAAFPSLALAWRITEEDFMKSLMWLNTLKARVSFGYSGNNNGVNAYGTQVVPNTDELSYYDFNGSVVTGFATGTPVNTALTWEKTREWNFGVDFGLFKGRINGSVDFYDKLSDGLLMARTLTIESGVESMRDNIGSVNNRGVEVGLSTVNVKNRDWEWRTSFTFAHNKNAIRSLYGKEEDVVGEKRFIGQPINVIYDYRVNGVYSQAEWAAATAEQRTNMDIPYAGAPKVVDTDGNGKIDTEDRVILGHTNPDWTGSFTSILRWKGLDFSFTVYSRQGVLVLDEFLGEFGAHTSDRGRPKVKFDYYVPGGVPRIDWNNFTTDETGQKWVNWEGVSEENASAQYPVHGYKGSHYGDNGRIQDASFVKVRNITLGYTLPKSLTEKISLSQARIYFNVLNPFTFTDYVGWDPEYATTSQANGNGPSTVVYQVGLNLKF
jgi:TonB-linked SusC/RagA family outer membrane protein